jgi:hypothetical protein
VLTRSTRTTTLGIGAVVVAIVCCAGLPAVATLLGGLTLGAVLGLGLGVLIVVVIAWAALVILARRRQHARCGDRRERG